MSHPSHQLFERLKSEFGPLPSGIDRISHQLQGMSFFPAGIGLFDPRAEFPVGGVMVLGHDWGTVANFKGYVTRDEERLTDPTWKHMVLFLDSAGIERRSVFFTNFFIGLRATGKSVGEHPARGDVDYVRLCRDFLLEQVEVQRPKLMLVLGTQVPPLLAPMSDALRGWGHTRTFRELDAAGAAVPRVKLHGSDHTFAAAVLVHPCHRPLNIKLRTWNGLKGDEAEVRMVKHLLTSS